MGDSQKIHQPSSLLHLQRRLHLPGAKRTAHNCHSAPLSWLTTSQILLFSVTMPTYILLLSSPIVPADTSDMIFSQLILGAIFLAFTADQQQWGKSIPP